MVDLGDWKLKNTDLSRKIRIGELKIISLSGFDKIGWFKNNINIKNDIMILIDIMMILYE